MARNGAFTSATAICKVLNAVTAGMLAAATPAMAAVPAMRIGQRPMIVHPVLHAADDVRHFLREYAQRGLHPFVNRKLQGFEHGAEHLDVAVEIVVLLDSHFICITLQIPDAASFISMPGRCLSPC